MAIIEYPAKHISKLKRSQLETAYIAVEWQRDRALAEIDRLRALYDPDNPEAVEAVRKVLYDGGDPAVVPSNPEGTWTTSQNAAAYEAQLEAREVLAALAGLVRPETNE